MKRPEDFYPKVDQSINSSAYKLGTPMSPYASGNFRIKTFNTNQGNHLEDSHEDDGYQTPPGMEDD